MTHERSSGDPEHDSIRPSRQGEGDTAFTNDNPGQDAPAGDSGSGFGAGVGSGGGGGATAARSSRGRSPRRDDDEGDGSSRPRRKRGSRGGKRSRRKTTASDDDGASPQDSGDGDRGGEAQDRDRGQDRDTGSESDGDGTRTKRPRRGRRRRSGGEGDAEGAGAPEAEGASEDDGEARSPRGRRSKKTKTSKATKTSRSGRSGRRKSADEDADKEAAADFGADGAEASEDRDGGDGGAPKKRRRRGKRGGRRRKRSGESSDSDGAEAALEIEVIPGEEDDLPELADLPDDAERIGGDDKPSRSRKASRSRKKVRGEKSDKPREKAASSTRKAKEVERTDVILVNASDPEEVRVAVARDGTIRDLQMTVNRYSSYVNDIYRGRVVNLEPAIGAAFVDFGQGRNGFLHASDVLTAYGEADWKLDKLLTTQIDADDWEGDDDDQGDSADEDASGDGDEEETSAQTRRKRSKKTAGKKAAKGGRGGRGKKGGAASMRRSRRPRMPIEKLLQKGQMVVCQITKDAIGDKGPTLTTYISIPGRYLVLMPSLARTGVSRKIEDEKERRRLKKILGALDIPGGMGVIVRTAGIGKTKAEIKRDLEYLLLAWEDFSRRLVSGRNPAPLYQESDVSVRTMRDLFGATTDKVVVDDPEVHGRMVEFTEKLMPENVERIQQHDGPRPLFHTYGVEQDFERIFQRRIELPSGGSIVLDQTEALVAIDVNSGRTRDEGADFEDIALKANLEAAPEIARQMRLRDLGGIIVLDFIDMMRAGNRRQVEKAFREAMADDRARSKIGRISQFGLLELTRQRLGPGLSKLIFDNCPTCRGSGRRRSAASRSQAILRRLGAALTMKGFSRVEVRAHPDTLEYVKAHLADSIEAMRESSGREIILTEVPDQVEDSVLRYLRADGREVRPGGRRKR